KNLATFNFKLEQLYRGAGERHLNTCANPGAQPIARIAGALELDDDGTMEQAVEQRGRCDWTAEDLDPFGDAAARGSELSDDRHAPTASAAALHRRRQARRGECAVCDETCRCLRRSWPRRSRG